MKKVILLVIVLSGFLFSGVTTATESWQGTSSDNPHYNYLDIEGKYKDWPWNTPKYEGRILPFTLLSAHDGYEDQIFTAIDKELGKLNTEVKLLKEENQKLKIEIQTLRTENDTVLSLVQKLYQIVVFLIDKVFTR